MTLSDRIHLFLAEGTPQYDQLVSIVGEPSCAEPSPIPPADEYCSGIELDMEESPTISSFQQRLSIYGDQPISTFSILC